MTLTALGAGDRDEFLDSLRDPEVREWQGLSDEAVTDWEKHYDRLITRRFRRRPAALAIRDVGSGVMIATYVYSPDVSDPLGETVVLGWWAMPAHRGKGRAREALQMVLKWLHDDVGVGMVIIGTRADNVRVLAQLRGTGVRLLEERETPLPNGTAPVGKWFVHEP